MFVEANGVAHPYCGKSCARAHKPTRKPSRVSLSPAAGIPRTPGTTPGDILSIPANLPLSPVSNIPPLPNVFKGFVPSTNAGAPVPPPKITNRFNTLPTIVDSVATNDEPAPSAYPDVTVDVPAYQGPVCRTPGCFSPAYIRPNGVASKYCGDSHKEYVSCPSFPPRQSCAERCEG